MVRIIAGEFRTRKLLTAKDDESTRPFLNRVKESVFSMLHEWFEDLDLPHPPLPPPIPGDFVFYLTYELSAFRGCCPGRPDRSPLVTSHFPEDGDLVAARRIQVIFAASEPLDPDAVDRGSVTVLAEEAGLIPGRVRYDPERWWIVWEPDGDLPRNDTIHVTLATDRIEDLGGNRLPSPVSLTFVTTR